MSEELTLRDQFAIAAINGLTSNIEEWPSNYENYAKHSYRVADAMLKERKNEI
jgi:hypothetical protein